ncbi:MAG: glycosyltransferase family 4 protein [Nitrososphaerales archaeon]
MKIAYVANQYLPSFGGIEAHVRMISECLAENGHDVYVVTTSLINGLPSFSLPKFEVINKVKVIRNRTMPWNIGRGWPAFSPSFPSTLIKLKPDVVHVHGLWPYHITNTALLLCKATEIKTVFTPHYHPQRAGRIRFLDRLVNRGILGLADSIIAITENEKEYYESIDLKDAALIPNPVDLHSFDKINATFATNKWKLNSRFLLLVARLTEGKKVERAIELIDKLPSTMDDVQLVVVGQDYGTARRLKSLSEKLGLTHRIIFTGAISDEKLNSLYWLSTLVLITSRYEAFGRTIIEAWAHEKPVAAFAGGGVIDALANNNGGLLAHDFEDFVKKVVYLLSDDTRISNLGTEGRRIVEMKYTTKAVGRSTLAIYERLVGSLRRS